MKEKVGIIGLGLMGSVLARRLIHAGHSVLGFDTDAEKKAPLEEMGGTFASSHGELAQSCARIVLAVFNTEQVISVVEDKLLPAIAGRGERIVLCTSTCDPDAIAALADRTLPRGLHLIEAPISGTSEQVRQGRGVGLVGGDPVRISEARDLLDAIFHSYFHLGHAGNGGRAKLAINLILGLNRLALAEGLVFAERMGLDPAAFLDVARNAASYSQVMDTKGPKMVRGDFTPEGRARQTLKDVQLMLEQASRIGQQLPLASVNAQVLEACLRAGEGDLDNSVVISEIRRRSVKQAIRPDGASSKTG